MTWGDRPTNLVTSTPMRRIQLCWAYDYELEVVQMVENLQWPDRLAADLECDQLVRVRVAPWQARARAGSSLSCSRVWTFRNAHIYYESSPINREPVAVRAEASSSANWRRGRIASLKPEGTDQGDPDTSSRASYGRNYLFYW